MEKIKCKANKHDNSYTMMLRVLIKQKEDIANNFKLENEKLQELLIKQQNLLNKLNEDNLRLNRSYNELKWKPCRSMYSYEATKDE